MAKKTKQKESRAPEAAATHTATAAPSSLQIRDERLSFTGYVLLNLIFWAYCALQLLALQMMLRDVPGLVTFFIILAVAFTVVSLYDYVYDRLSGGNADSVTDKSTASQ